MMSDFVLWVRRVSLTFAIVALAAGASWAHDPLQGGDDDGLEAPQVEDNHAAGDDPAQNPGPDDPVYIAVGNPPADNPPADPGNPPITVDDQGNPLVTPEPATLVLLTTGAAGTVIARWRKRGR